MRAGVRPVLDCKLGPAGMGGAKFDAAAGEGKPKNCQDFEGRLELKNANRGQTNPT
jgi:hypothetical protein